MKARSFLIGPGLTCNLDALVNTRLLVQANSGGGKSWALRRLLEQTHGHLQQLVVDPEGEFASLREKFDYILAARQGGETLADPRSAKLLAERLLELGVSAVLDIYELKAHERVRFVRVFLEALVDAPKALWHPALVVLDEAHVYCPQQGEAESAGAVIDLCTRGRKRGYCAVIATQRLSKLHKDAAAECNNKLIGRSALDVDMKRAADELGFASREQQQRLRELDPGEFFAFGPALSRTVALVKVGSVETSHPKAGSRLAGVVPPPTEKVKAVLSKLADLPAEAEAREKTIADLKRDVATLRRQLSEAHREARAAAPAAPKVERKAVPVLTDADRDLLNKLASVIAQRAGKASELLAAAESRADKLVQSAVAEYLNLTRQVSFDAAKELNAALDRAGVQKVLGKVAVASAPPMTAPPAVRPGNRPVPRPTPRGDPADDGQPLAPARQRILAALAWLASVGIPQPNRTQLALWCAVSPTSGGYFNNLGALRSAGYVDYPAPASVALTGEGARVADPRDVPTTTQEMQELLFRRVGPTRAAILRVLIGRYPKDLSRDDLAEAVRVSGTSGGYFNNLGFLRTLGVIDYPRPGFVVAQPLLFLESR